MACGRTVAPAIIWRTEVRAALDYLARNFDVGQARIVAVGFGAPTWILWDTTGLWRVGRVPPCIPIGGPFPDVPDHVVDTIAVWRKRGDRGRALEAILTQMLSRKLALPRVCLVLAAGCEFVAPGIFGAVESATRGKS